MLDLTKIPEVLRSLPWKEPTTEDRFVERERLMTLECWPSEEGTSIEVLLVVPFRFWVDPNEQSERRYGWNQDMLDAVLAFVCLDPPSE